MGSDLGSLGFLLVPVVVLSKITPLLLIVGAVWFFRSNRGGRMWNRVPGGADPETVAELRAELDEVRRELAELQERVDFSERLLAQGQHGQPEARGSASPEPVGR